VLFAPSQQPAFLRGTAVRLSLSNLKDSLGEIYGFEKLCFRSAG
jgi:hypothetical protein